MIKSKIISVEVVFETQTEKHIKRTFENKKTKISIVKRYCRCGKQNDNWDKNRARCSTCNKLFGKSMAEAKRIAKIRYKPKFTIDDWETTKNYNKLNNYED